MKRAFLGLGVAVGLMFLGSTSAVNAEKAPSSVIESPLKTTIASIKLPPIEQPAWLKAEIAAEKAAAKASGGAAHKTNGATRTITYDTMTSGALVANFVEFRTLANQTLNDSRGWARMNVKFKEVPSNGQFSLVLAEASRLPSYSSGCSADYSCRAGRYVVINQDRWQGATPSWNSAGGSLRDYRHMVVNHETGHWLGHGHTNCGGAGQAASVMQQQSIELQGCSFNAWPLVSELW